ncbi:class I SAM-dependent methyltransferase [Thiolapillus sp.]
MKHPVTIIAAGRHKARAEALAARLNYPLACSLPDEPGFFLEYTHERLQLRQTGSPAPGPVYVDFCTGKSAHRRRQGEGRRAPLARAVGMKPGMAPPRILDATAGLGRDAFVLATLGCEVLMVEQSPLVHALLEDGLRRAAGEPGLEQIISRMSLILGNAVELLESMQPLPRPDCIYLDPMYPHKGKTALAKKEMRTLQQLLGADRQGAELLTAARRKAGRRVAVKRPARADFLGQRKPDFQIRSPKTRYDIYLPSSASAIQRNTSITDG